MDGHKFTTIRCKICVTGKEERGGKVRGREGGGKGKGGERQTEGDRGRGEGTWNRAAGRLRPALESLKDDKCC